LHALSLPVLTHALTDVKDIKLVVNVRLRLSSFCIANRCQLTSRLSLSTPEQYDFPGSPEDYVHRIGRTGRAGAHGRAWTLFTDKNARNARALVDILREADQPVPPELARLVGGGGGGGGFRSRGYGGGYGGGGLTGANALPLGSGARRSPPSPW
jgi:hypothetical protein